jgi:hypothetical protein
MASTGYNVCLFNSADPRGGKVGGIETYQLMRNGALTPGRVVKAVVAYSPQALLGKIFADHRRLYDLG